MALLGARLVSFVRADASPALPLLAARRAQALLPRQTLDVKRMRTSLSSTRPDHQPVMALLAPSGWGSRVFAVRYTHGADDAASC
jgi:hypothetical protein